MSPWHLLWILPLGSLISTGLLCCVIQGDRSDKSADRGRILRCAQDDRETEDGERAIRESPLRTGEGKETR